MRAKFTQLTEEDCIEIYAFFTTMLIFNGRAVRSTPGYMPTGLRP